jgi:hypothetical protein|tara:strand:- start:46 stop:270 length:225 start_codon:yes stop_codon:yes gene_type:complete
MNACVTVPLWGPDLTVIPARLICHDRSILDAQVLQVIGLTVLNGKLLDNWRSYFTRSVVENTKWKKGSSHKNAR